MREGSAESKRGSQIVICLIVRRRRWVQNVLRSRKPLSKLRMHKPIMQKVAASMIMQMTLCKRQNSLSGHAPWSVGAKRQLASEADSRKDGQSGSHGRVARSLAKDARDLVDEVGDPEDLDHPRAVDARAGLDSDNDLRGRRPVVSFEGKRKTGRMHKNSASDLPRIGSRRRARRAKR